MDAEKSPRKTEEPVISPSQDTDSGPNASTIDGKSPPPLLAKLFAVFLISCISFGSHWSSGVTGAMKSTIKKQMQVSNTQFSLLEASEDFMATLLLLISGIVTDRVGGAEMIVYGNIIYTVGSILVAAATTVRSFNFMIGGRVILALGDIATQVAQYKMFSSWFPPSNGFASTLGFELAIGKNTGNFAWVFWTSVFMNLFTNAATAIFYFFTRYCNKHYTGRQDSATKEVLTEKNKKFEFQKVFQLPWMFWAVMAFSLFQTSTALVFSQNATELAEKVFDVNSITAGWYSSLSQYAVCVCGFGIFLSMFLVNFANTEAGTAASFGIYAIAVSLGPTSIIDSIRTTLWHQSVFGSAYALKVTMNNAMNIIVRIITGALQDADSDSYDRVVRVYLFLAAASVIVGLAILVGSLTNDSLRPLQWTRKRRMTVGAEHIEKQREWHLVTCYNRSRVTSLCCFCTLMMLVLGGWAAYIWGAVTGNNS
ncbi:putative MFS transporter [Aspergillus foveolatus]|uniref:putative MFS transporter n=1 Tax=Aspergillus foveolatus TaxID=210207 RepID=UPI003CCCDF8C